MSTQIKTSLGLDADTSLTLVNMMKAARAGIKMSVLSKLAQNFNMTLSDFSKILPVSSRTLQRYDANKVLPKALSDHTLQIIKVFEKAVNVFEDKETAVKWIRTPIFALGNVPPLDFFDTFSGVEIVYDELIRIEYGVFA